MKDFNFMKQKKEGSVRMSVNGHFIYTSADGECSYASAQVPSMIEAFRNLIQEVKPVRVLEIGTFQGGTTIIIRDLLDEAGLQDSKIKSFDAYDNNWSNHLLNKDNLDIVVDNIFSESYFELEKPEKVQPFIQQEGLTLVLCDGGYKISEFNLLSPFLKSGDIIMAHDYVDTKGNFESNFKDKIWNWREIGDEHVKKACEENNLHAFHKEEMDKAVWACFRKEQHEL